MSEWFEVSDEMDEAVQDLRDAVARLDGLLDAKPLPASTFEAAITDVERAFDRVQFVYGETVSGGEQQ